MNVRPAILLLSIGAIVVISINSIFIKTLSSELDDFKEYKAIFHHAEVLEYEEYTGKKGVTKIYRRLTFFLVNDKTRITLNEEDYSQFFQPFLSGRYIMKEITFHLRNGGDMNVNPMQIEVDGEIILPLSFHKELSKRHFLIFTGVFIVLLAILVWLVRKYKKKYLKEDAEMWRKSKFNLLVKWLSLY